MRKYLRYLDTAVALTGMAGLLLNLWLLQSGTDHRGLYPAYHPAWICLCILSILALAAIWLATRQVGTNRSYRSNFPASIAGAIGSAAAAVSVTLAGLNCLADAENLFAILAGLMGVFGGVGLAMAALCRRSGRKIPFLYHMLPCLFFALRAFLMVRTFGSEPEPARYLFQILASIALIPASYQLWAFDVGCGQRPTSLFWSLLAAYLCIVSIPGSKEWLLHMTVACWLLTNLCVLRYLPQRKRPEIPTLPLDIPDAAPIPILPEPEEEETPETPVEPEAPPAEAEPETPPKQEETGELDPEAILTEIMREIDSQIS